MQPFPASRSRIQRLCHRMAYASPSTRPARRRLQTPDPSFRGAGSARSESAPEATRNGFRSPQNAAVPFLLAGNRPWSLASAEGQELPAASGPRERLAPTRWLTPPAPAPAPAPRRLPGRSAARPEPPVDNLLQQFQQRSKVRLPGAASSFKPCSTRGSLSKDATLTSSFSKPRQCI